MMKRISTVLVSLFTTAILYCQSNLPSIITQDTILSLDNSPYYIASNMTIDSGVTVTIEAGVTIKFGTNAKITVSGSLIAEGTETDSIYFTSNVPGAYWDRIANNSANLIELHYVKTIDNIMFIFGYYGNDFIVSHCNVVSMALGSGQDCIAIEYGKKVVIEYLTLKGAGGKIANGIKNDAIDLDDCDSCLISYSHIYNFSDDGIDIGTTTKYVFIHDNIINNCNYGITIGETSLAYLYNNIAYNNDGGFQIHTGATAYCENNTLYGNTVGIEAFHSEDGTVTQTGGTVVMKNTIFSNNIQTDIYSQTSSIIDISYSLSDKDSLPGDHNLFGNPLLYEPENGIFNLTTNSPCIGTGIDSIGDPINMGVLLPVMQGNLITNTLADNLINLYPNPCSDYIRVSSTSHAGQNYTANLYDCSGKILLKTELNQANNTIDIRNMQTGIYFIKIIFNDNSSSVAKIIKL